jgi:hypothetical protein
VTDRYFKEANARGMHVTLEVTHLTQWHQMQCDASDCLAPTALLDALIPGTQGKIRGVARASTAQLNKLQYPFVNVQSTNGAT